MNVMLRQKPYADPQTSREWLRGHEDAQDPAQVCVGIQGTVMLGVKATFAFGGCTLWDVGYNKQMYVMNLFKISGKVYFFSFKVGEDDHSPLHHCQ